MRLNHTHLVPVLTIVAGGVIGASLSFSFLELRSDDAAVPESVVNAYESVERAEVRRSEQDGITIEVEIRRILIPVERPRISIEVEVDSAGSVLRSYRVAGVESGSR